MPLMGGFELQEVLRTNNPALPILFLTGHGTIPMSVRAMRNGAFDFIEKPFTSEHLVRVTRQALEKRALLLENRRLKEALPTQDGLPVIGQTAHALDEERATCLAAGMVDHLAKPLDPDQLIASILRHARPRPTA